MSDEILKWWFMKPEWTEDDMNYELEVTSDGESDLTLEKVQQPLN